MKVQAILLKPTDTDVVIIPRATLIRILETVEGQAVGKGEQSFDKVKFAKAVIARLADHTCKCGEYWFDDTPDSELEQLIAEWER